MSAVMVGSVRLPENHTPRKLNQVEAESPDLPDEVYDHIASGYELPWVWAPHRWRPAHRLEAGDVLIFQDEEGEATIYTILCLQEHERVSDQLWPHEDSPNDTVYFLIHSSDLDLDAYDGPDLFQGHLPINWPPIRSTEFGSRNVVSNRLHRTLDHLERRRLYRFFAADVLHGFRIRGRLRRSARSLLTWAFEDRLSLVGLKHVGLLVAFLLFLLGALVEATCVATIFGGLAGLTRPQCMHVFTLSMVDIATQFSFSLTAFLLVSVAVVVAVTDQQVLPDRFAQLEIETVEELEGLDGVRLDELRITRFPDDGSGPDGPVYSQWVRGWDRINLIALSSDCSDHLLVRNS